MAKKVPGLARVLGAGSLASVAYGEIGSSIYFALGIVALYALGVTPWVLLFVGALFMIVALSYAEGTAALPETGGAATFVRRAYLDTIGTLPTMDETNAFLADTAPDKREKLVDALLARKEYVDYWTYKWSDVLTINGTRLRPPAVKAYYMWLRERVEKNTPWDETVRQVLTATGDSLENGATNFYALQQSPEDMTENACQAFLGLSIGCAKCHNHPLEKWTNDQYYAFANMFSRVRAKGWGGDYRGGDGLRVVYTDTQGELIQPSRGTPQPPAPLDEQPLAFEPRA